jgi:hypothetical protein
MSIMMLALGVVALIRGRFVLMRRRVVYGTPARVVAVILMFALPLDFVVMFSFLRPDEETTFSLIEIGTMALCLAAALAVAGYTARPLPKKREVLAMADIALAYYEPSPPSPSDQRLSHRRSTPPDNNGLPPPSAADDHIQE